MVVTLSVLLFLTAGFQLAPPSIQEQASVIFKKNCNSCHGDTGFAKSSMLLDRNTMVRTGKVIPGRGEDSILYKRVSGLVEPIMPEGGPKLSLNDVVTIKQWIDAGAPDWRPPSADARRFISTDDVIAAIESDLRSANSDTSRAFYRYFVLTNLYNAGDSKLPTYRLALAKLLNSLSWDKDIILPKAVDREATVFRIDLREYGWSDPARTWETILAGYPYGVEYPSSAFSRIQILTSSDIPFIRADWFLAAASMPPLYHDILELPSSETELENCDGNARRCLNVDTERNLRDSPGVRVARAGFTESGVSNSNRIVERHRSPYGAYWKSHDFPDNVGDHNIFQHPLDFQRAGGEIIFNLPNGLQAYLLVNERGERIDQAPTNIVFNKGGTRAEIRNGLSCMSCHTDGIRPLTDEVRATLTFLPEDQRSYAYELYPENETLQKLLSQDRERFQAASRRTGVSSGAEPITELSERYATSIDASAAASELGLTSDEFIDRIKRGELFRQLGLSTLLSGGAVKRDAWEDVFGDVVQELRLGNWTPPTLVYGERFFNASTEPPRLRFRPNLSELKQTIMTGLIGRPIQSVESKGLRTYSIRDVRFSSDCTVDIVDTTRLSNPSNPLIWWSEEDTQTISLGSVGFTMAPEGAANRLTASVDAPATIRLERSFSSNGRNDSSLPRSGTTVEFVNTVVFDLPLDSQTNRAFEAFLSAVARCSVVGNR